MTAACQQGKVKHTCILKASVDTVIYLTDEIAGHTNLLDTLYFRHWSSKICYDPTKTYKDLR